LHRQIHKRRLAMPARRKHIIQMNEVSRRVWRRSRRPETRAGCGRSLRLCYELLPPEMTNIQIDQ